MSGATSATRAMSLRTAWPCMPSRLMSPTCGSGMGPWISSSCCGCGGAEIVDDQAGSDWYANYVIDLAPHELKQPVDFVWLTQSKAHYGESAPVGEIAHC